MFPISPYNIGLAMLQAAKDFLKASLPNVLQSVNQATTKGLKIKGARAIVEGVGVVKVDLHLVVASNPIILSKYGHVSAKDTRLFVLNFCFNFCYNLAVPRLLSDESVQNFKEKSSSVLADQTEQFLGHFSSSVSSVVAQDNHIVNWLAGYYDGFRKNIGSLVSNNLNVKCASKGAIAVMGLCAQSILLGYFVNFEEDWNFKYIGAAVLSMKLTEFISAVVQKGIDKVILNSVQSYLESAINIGDFEHQDPNIFIKNEVIRLGKELNSTEIDNLTQKIIGGNFLNGPALNN